MTDIDQGTSRPVYFFVHVPKCAGTTFIKHFTIHAGDRFAQARRLESIKRLFGGNYVDADALAPHAHHLDIVAGHSLSKSLRDVFAGREIREILFLREPLDFIISFYNYKNRRARQKHRGPINFDLFYNSIPINPVSRFIINRYLEIGYPRILYYSSRERLSMLNEVLATFWFVGSHRYCNEVISTISEEIGIQSEVQRRNIGDDSGLTKDDLSQSTRDRILRENKLDQCLFDMWSDAKWSQQPSSSSINVSDVDYGAHIGREISRNFTYPLIHMKRRLAT